MPRSRCSRRSPRGSSSRTCWRVSRPANGPRPRPTTRRDARTSTSYSAASTRCSPTMYGPVSARSRTCRAASSTVAGRCCWRPTSRPSTTARGAATATGPSRPGMPRPSSRPSPTPPAASWRRTPASTGPATRSWRWPPSCACGVTRPGSSSGTPPAGSRGSPPTAIPRPACSPTRSTPPGTCSPGAAAPRRASSRRSGPTSPTPLPTGHGSPTCSSPGRPASSASGAPARVPGRRRRRLRPARARRLRQRLRGRARRGPRQRGRGTRRGARPRGRHARHALGVERLEVVRVRAAPRRRRVPGLGAVRTAGKHHSVHGAPSSVASVAHPVVAAGRPRRDRPAERVGGASPVAPLTDWPCASRRHPSRSVHQQPPVGADRQRVRPAPRHPAHRDRPAPGASARRDARGRRAAVDDRRPVLQPHEARGADRGPRRGRPEDAAARTPGHVRGRRTVRHRRGDGHQDPVPPARHAASCSRSPTASSCQRR